MEVHKYDGLSQEICHLCAHKVTLCYDLIQQFLNANSKLLMYRNEREEVKQAEDDLLSATLSEDLLVIIIIIIKRNNSSEFLEIL